MAHTIDELSANDPIVKHLVRAMNSGPWQALDDAATELIDELGLSEERVHAAVAKIRAFAVDVQTAQEPRAVVAGNIESWYVGPTADARNWPTLVGILREERWDDGALRDLDESSTKVVAQLPNPHGSGAYGCRGLVLGYVQSGKTTSFTAVIAKAAGLDPARLLTVSDLCL